MWERNTKTGGETRYEEKTNHCKHKRIKAGDNQQGEKIERELEKGCRGKEFQTNGKDV